MSRDEVGQRQFGILDTTDAEYSVAAEVFLELSYLLLDKCDCRHEENNLSDSGLRRFFQVILHDAQ